MSRIIVSKYDDGSNHVVVGWDHPAGGAFWQEWASKQEIAEAEAWMDAHVDDYDVDVETERTMERISETGVKREGGMWPGIPLDKLKESMPDELQPLMTDKVMQLLSGHAANPDSGYAGNPNSIVDLTV